MLGIMVGIIVALLIAPAHARDWKQDAQDDIKAFRNAPAPAPAPPATAAQPAQPKQSSERQEAEKRAATAKFPSSNSEKGCLALMTAISTRIETVFSLNGEKCSELKNKFQGKSDIIDCMLASATTWNRGHGRGDIDELPTNVSEDIMKGCFMMLTNLSEQEWASFKQRYK